MAMPADAILDSESYLPELSVIVPVCNEAEAIADLLREAAQEFVGRRVEIIVVDDGSTDGSVLAAEGVLQNGRLGDVPVRLISHPNRSGKSAALRTGALAARARWIATMDGDGQDRPVDVTKMAEAVDLGTVGKVGLVGGVRRARTDGNSRKYASRAANGLRRAVLKDDCPDTACGLKLLPKDLFLAMPFFDALHRYLPAFVRHFGYETAYVPVDNRARQFGESKYSNIGRAAAGMADLLGVVWLMRRTSIPAPALLLRPAEEKVSADVR